MVTVAFAPGVTGNVSQVVNLVDLMSTGATLVGLPSATILTLASPPFFFTITGSNFTYTPVGPDVYLSGGTIDEIQVLQSGAAYMSVTNIGLSASALFTAIIAEESGANIAALETLFTGLSYNYQGLPGADIHLRTAVSGDNVTLNLRGNDKFDLKDGNDRVFSGDGNDTLNGGRGRDTLEGGVGNDRLVGGSGKDRLLGESGSDKLDGGTENDYINGGADADTMVGGLGVDVFRFGRLSDTGLGAGRDKILDFTAGDDIIDLSGHGLSFRGSAAFTGAAPEVRFATNGVDGFLHIDSNGNGTIDGTIVLTGVTAFGGFSIDV